MNAYSMLQIGVRALMNTPHLKPAITAKMAEFQNKKFKQGTMIPEKRKRHGISSKCASLVKEQRARIYILRRCATMLLCWYIQGDD
ncbi:hypothetical protein RIF29_16596 [Crotalaria pallida]|uniref:Uncharacterized protein n=1 Tax=Crotalaria pallida TaxID=3830 RepID=A0AAN9FP17_CROPI